MGMTYTDSYETRKAYSNVVVSEVDYVIDYIIKSPIDGKANEVNATFYRVDGDNGENKFRLGYGSHSDRATTVRFDSSGDEPIEVQRAINEQFMNDLTNILK